MKKVIERIQSSISRIVLEDTIMMEIVMTMPSSGFDSLLLMCAEEEVVVLAAGYEDTMFGSGSIITPSYKLSKNLKRNIRLLQMADPRLFK